MANKYSMVKCYFEHGLWSQNQVKDSVTKGLITSKEYQDITGEEFDDSYLRENENKSKKLVAYKQFVVNTFTDKTFMGNSAAVCILNSAISDSLMQKVAAQNNLPETAFVLKRGSVYALRWFTSAGEIDVSGHATLAAAFVIFNYYEKTKNSLEFETILGQMLVEKNDDVFEIEMPHSELKQVKGCKELTEALGAEPKEVYYGKDVMCVFETEDDIVNLTPDFKKLSSIKGSAVHATAKSERCDFVSRSFAPKLGMDEELVCGSGYCYIAPYWKNVLDKTVMAGCHVSKRGGTVYCKFITKDVLRLCGKTVLYSSGEIYL